MMNEDQIKSFLEGYGLAISAVDLAAISSCWEVPRLSSFPTRAPWLSQTQLKSSDSSLRGANGIDRKVWCRQRQSSKGLRCSAKRSNLSMCAGPHLTKLAKKSGASALTTYYVSGMTGSRRYGSHSREAERKKQFRMYDIKRSLAI